MLKKGELHNLLQILSEEEKTFENYFNNFQKQFSKMEQFRGGCGIQYLIQENVNYLDIYVVIESETKNSRIIYIV